MICVHRIVTDYSCSNIKLTIPSQESGWILTHIWAGQLKRKPRTNNMQTIALNMEAFTRSSIYMYLSRSAIASLRPLVDLRSDRPVVWLLTLEWRQQKSLRVCWILPDVTKKNQRGILIECWIPLGWACQSQWQSWRWTQQKLICKSYACVIGMAYILEHNCFHMMCGLMAPDANRESAILSSFWSRFRHQNPTHPIYSMAARGEVDLATTVPIVCHGDEGRGAKRQAFMVVNFHGLLGRGTNPQRRWEKSVESSPAMCDTICLFEVTPLQTAFFLDVCQNTGILVREKMCSMLLWKLLQKKLNSWQLQASKIHTLEKPIVAWCWAFAVIGHGSKKVAIWIGPSIMFRNGWLFALPQQGCVIYVAQDRLISPMNKLVLVDHYGCPLWTNNHLSASLRLFKSFLMILKSSQNFGSLICSIATTSVLGVSFWDHTWHYCKKSKKGTMWMKGLRIWVNHILLGVELQNAMLTWRSWARRQLLGQRQQYILWGPGAREISLQVWCFLWKTISEIMTLVTNRFSNYHLKLLLQWTNAFAFATHVRSFLLALMLCWLQTWDLDSWDAMILWLIFACKKTGHCTSYSPKGMRSITSWWPFWLLWKTNLLSFLWTLWRGARSVTKILWAGQVGLHAGQR